MLLTTPSRVVVSRAWSIRLVRMIRIVGIIRVRIDAGLWIVWAGRIIRIVWIYSWWVVWAWRVVRIVIGNPVDYNATIDISHHSPSICAVSSEP